MSDEGKMIIYQALPRLFGNLNGNLKRNGDILQNKAGKFSAFSNEALEKIKELGVTHIWYTGVIMHATKTGYSAYGIRHDHCAIVKGNAGSPYAIKDYYDVDPDLADNVWQRMDEFEALVGRTHEAGMKVIIDFVPNHVARQYHSAARLPYVKDLGEDDNLTVAFDRNNNFYYIPGQALDVYFDSEQEPFGYSEFPARATGNNRFDTTPARDDWYEAIKLNYGVDYMGGGRCYFDPVPDTWIKMRDILLFWSGKGIDGFRCDMAEMVPVEFWNWAIPQVKMQHDALFIAEVYNPQEYHNYIYTGGFDYLYDKVGLYDTLREVMTYHRPASGITGCWQAVENIQGRMLNFLENHDEQRIASGFFAGKPSPGIPATIVAALMNTNPYMLYSGQELGEQGMDEEGFSGLDGRTSIFDYWSMKSVRNWINGGKFDGKMLTPAQRELRLKYMDILRIAAGEETVSRGIFFDLMYANEGNPAFNLSKQYAFIRKYGNELLFIVANFDEAEQHIRVRIPSEAFEAAGIDGNTAAKVTDLLTGYVTIGMLTDAWPYQLVIPGHSGSILKFEYS